MVLKITLNSPKIHKIYLLNRENPQEWVDIFCCHLVGRVLFCYISLKEKMTLATI